MRQLSGEMFCPICGAILVLKRRGRAIKKYCPKCKDFVTDGGVVDTVPLTGVRKGANSKLKGANNKSAGDFGGAEFPLFPYPKIRAGQREFMAHSRKAIEAGRHLIAQAPTGIGKTAAVLSTALEYGLNDGLFVMFLTSKQSHHNIAVETLKEISSRTPQVLKVVDVIAKRDMCLRPEKRLPYGAFNEFCKAQIKGHLCPFYEAGRSGVLEHMRHEILSVNEMIDTCIKHGVCPHAAAMDLAKEADVMICDYNYVFSPHSESIIQRIGLDLGKTILIVDEAHNLPDRVSSHLNTVLTLSKIDEAAKELRDIDPKLYRRVLSIGAVVGDMLSALPSGQERYMTKEELLNRIKPVLVEDIMGGMSIEAFIDALIKASDEVISKGSGYSYALDLADFLDKWGIEADGVCRIMSRVDGDRIILKLLDPSVITSPVFESVHSAILMSATLYPQEMYRDVLGLEAERTDMRSYPSPFPPENKLVLTARGITTLYRARGEAMYTAIAGAIAGIVEGTEGNTAVFFPSYAILDKVSYILSGMDISKRILIEERGMSKMERDGLVERLYRYRKRGVVMLAVLGGSMSEGMDYADNVLSTVVIVGIPFAPPGLENIAVREYYSKKFGRDKGNLYGYVLPAFQSVVQAAGRLIRSERDRGVVVLLDERYSRRDYMRYLPADLRPILVPLKDLPKRVQSFHNA